MKRGRVVRRTVKHYPWGKVEIVVKRYGGRKRRTARKRIIKTLA